MNTDIFAMSLYTDIQKITQIPCSKENSLFILQQKYNTNKRNLRMRKYKPPKNANLYDKDDNDSYDQICNDISQEKCCLPENEIACSIKEATGGIDYSNENLEEQWRIRQMEATSHNYYDCKSLPATVGIDSSLSEIKTDIIKDTQDEENILRQCRLNKNAAIRGLLKNHIISTQDLEVPIDSINITQSNVDVQNTNMFSLTNLYGENHIKLVPCQEDPEVLHQPLQAYGGIDENKYKDIDFSVPHIGKKTTVTSRQFFLGMNDSDFDFVRKDSKKKK